MRGVYFLANDRIAEQATAFLNSFRQYNPEIPLHLIPFADDADGIRTLSAQYNFSVYDDDDMLQVCDEISRAFHDGTVMGHYRKLCAWTGPFDEFVYIDSDTIVLRSIDFVFDFLDRYDFLTSHSDIESIRKWVWRDSIHQTSALSPAQIGFAASTGFVASKRGLLDPAKVLAELAGPLVLAPHMELLCAEQPLLNYLIVTAGGPYSSLSVIAADTHDPDLPQEQWAGGDIGEVRAGVLIPSHVRRTLLVHWAGEWRRVEAEGGRVPYHDLWWHYRSMTD